MNWAVVALSKKSLQLALKIKSKIKTIDIYVVDRYANERAMPIVGKLKEFNGFLFKSYETIVYIMATGIVVRDIQPYLKHKSIDPAILVLDTNGRFVISLLSGHLGGANEKAKYLASEINAIPVITTASDCMNKLSVDMIAKANNLRIKSFEKAKDITALIVNDEKVGIFIESDRLIYDIPEYIEYVEKLDKGLDIKGLICISNKAKMDFDVNAVQLIPRNIVIGVGCRKDISVENFESFIKDEMIKANISLKAVESIVSIDLKNEEKCIIEFAKKHRIVFDTYTKEELAKVEDRFEGSSFVKSITGVSSVCITSGYLKSGKGTCLVPKVKKDGMTMSIWQM
ncbi:cobalt-precorrin 5A hydrolase [Clostridiaceae bacterium M8S5]|nr:cobalt-precorrin 5A hydrolase [Clostridiaceae bacterium M8S5]